MTSAKTQTKIPDDDEILDGAVFTIRQTRYLKIVVIVMGIMLVFGFVALAIAVMNRASTKKQAPITPPPGVGTRSGQAVPLSARHPANRILKPDITLPLPRGTTLKSYKISGNRLVLHVSQKKQDQLVILDLVSGATLSRISLPRQ